MHWAWSEMEVKLFRIELLFNLFICLGNVKEQAWASTMLMGMGINQECPSWILAPPAPGKGGSPDIDQAQRQEETGPGVPPQLPQAGQWVYGLLSPPQTKLL